MTDHKLLRLLKADRNAGMTALIRQFSGLVYSIAGGIMDDVCDSSEIEDCVADVFIKFESVLERFEPNASIKTYLGIIARNTAINSVRGRVAQTPIDGGDFFIEIPDKSDVGEEIAQKELVERIFDEIKKMGYPDSYIVFAKYYLGQSSKTIAKRLGLTVSNVDTRAHRATQRLKNKFGG